MVKTNKDFPPNIKKCPLTSEDCLGPYCAWCVSRGLHWEQSDDKERTLEIRTYCCAVPLIASKKGLPNIEIITDWWENPDGEDE